MSEPRDAPPALDRADRDLVRRLAEAYRAPEMSPGRRAAFDARLRERLARRPRSRGLRASLTAAALAAGLAALVWSIGPRPRAPTVPPPTPTGAPVRLAADPVVSPEELLLDLVSAEPRSAGEAPPAEEALPEDYVAIAGLLLEAR